jgi:hypothetical protein
MTQSDRTEAALNLVAKWRTLFTGWQVGTRVKGDPEGDAVRDHREVSILLRVESSAMARVLLEKGIITRDEWMAALEAEALELDALYQRQFPGVRASAEGLTIDRRALPWMKGWPA